MIYSFGDFEIDEGRFELRRSGVRVAVQPKVLSLIIYLAAHGERMVTKEELMRVLWPDVRVSEASLTRATKEARRAIGDRGQDIISTVRTRGLRFVARLEQRDEREERAPATAPASAPADNPRPGPRVLFEEDLRGATSATLSRLALLARSTAGVKLVVMALAEDGAAAEGIMPAILAC